MNCDMLRCKTGHNQQHRQQQCTFVDQEETSAVCVGTEIHLDRATQTWMQQFRSGFPKCKDFLRRRSSLGKLSNETHCCVAVDRDPSPIETPPMGATLPP